MSLDDAKWYIILILLIAVIVRFLMNTRRKYLMVCDERGTTRWPSPTSRTWAFGGFIVQSQRRRTLIARWTMVKRKLCGDDSVELKWSHFFLGRHQERMENPLLSSDPQKWRGQAVWAISELFGATDLLPVTTYIRKDEASDDAFDIKEDGRKVLDINTLWVGVLAQFSLFLEGRNATGEIWFDQLGSRKEEERKQHEWEQLRDGEWPVHPENQLKLRRIDPVLKFLDSQTEPLVQIADFISGVIWAASEGDEEFLLRAFDKYFPTGPRTFGLLRIQ